MYCGMRPPVKNRLNTTSALTSFMPRICTLLHAYAIVEVTSSESTVASTVLLTEIHMLVVNALVLKMA